MHQKSGVGVGRITDNNSIDSIYEAAAVGAVKSVYTGVENT